MRIRRSDDPHKADGLAELIEANAPGQMTRSQKRKNWWHYHKWYVVSGIVLFAALIHIIGNALGLFSRSPDLQIAYVGIAPLPEDTACSLEQTFALLIEDLNGDGEIIVQVNQYTGDPHAIDAEAAYYQYASEITLIGDISDCESYLFLLEDPQGFQQDFQILAMPDGSCPVDADYSVDNKVIRWPDCPLLASMDMGSYTLIAAGEEITGSNQELLSRLYLGRRCFPSKQTAEHENAYNALWEDLADSSHFPERMLP